MWTKNTCNVQLVWLLTLTNIREPETEDGWPTTKRSSPFGGTTQSCDIVFVGALASRMFLLWSQMRNCCKTWSLSQIAQIHVQSNTPRDKKIWKWIDARDTLQSTKNCLLWFIQLWTVLEFSKRHFVQTHVAVNSGISNSFGLLPLNVLPSLICSPHDRICLVDSPTQPHCCGILWIALCE
jgi:hypothetical protein